ncbi:MAG TPA: glycosyl hydrolase family 18 protein [Trebonia sp.]|nr:glycosyl hydrolase family 18 protein [Trebonia sp.]
MRRLIPLAVAALAAAGLSSAALAGAASAATAAPTHAPAFRASALPAHIYAPYFESWDSTDGGLAQLSHESGAKYLNLAFLQTAQAGSCTPYWNGDTSTPISATAAGSFGADIAAIQRAGGNVIPSFGGYTADTTNTELADSCTSVDAIAKVYESLVTTYHISRIDLDVEADSVTNTAGIERRNEAVAQAEAWAAWHHLPLSFSYTLPTFPTGLPAAELSVLQNAVAEHAKIAVVNLEAFDYYFGTQQDMLADAESAATGLEGQLATLYPGVPARALWQKVGITEMPGIDDFGPDETFSTTQAHALEQWAAVHGLGELSIWALQRDNGSCPGTKGAGACSGVTQPTWYFDHVFEPFSYLPAGW